MSPFGDFSPKKITVCNVYSDKGVEELSTSISRSCVLVFLYILVTVYCLIQLYNKEEMKGEKAKGHMSYPPELPSNFAKVPNNTIS
jgi:hypothetical protein